MKKGCRRGLISN